VVSEVSKAGDIYHWPFFLRPHPSPLLAEREQMQRIIIPMLY
jgi:hypothetical protein